jgi:hypothetical protein
MKPLLKQAYRAEIAAAARAGRHDQVMHHLARAHILSQRHTGAHTYVHWLMFKAGWAAKDGREVRGQIKRMVAAAVFSRIWVPAGNTGLANVSAIRPMPVPEDLRPVLEASG